MGYFVGIDGGATKTACAVGDATRVLGRGVGGPSNLLRVSASEAQASLRGAIQTACSAAGVAPQAVSATCIGVAGASVPKARETAQRLVSDLVAGAVEVVGDMEIALSAAFPDGVGLVVLAGTGSIAYGRNQQGATARAGGWGHAISDEGSGYWIGRAAVAALLRARDAGEATRLAEAISEAWQLCRAEELVARANSFPPPDFAALLPVVVRAAQSGDAIAASVLSQAGAELAKLAEIPIRALWPADRWVQVGIAGGVFEHSAVVRHSFIDHLHRANDGVQVNEAIVQPVDGALARARRRGSEVRHAQSG